MLSTSLCISEILNTLPNTSHLSITHSVPAINQSINLALFNLLYVFLFFSFWFHIWVSLPMMQTGETGCQSLVPLFDSAAKHPECTSLPLKDPRVTPSSRTLRSRSNVLRAERTVSLLLHRVRESVRSRRRRQRLDLRQLLHPDSVCTDTHL